MRIKKAVIPAAGLGTRFLPVTKSMPKEMLPLIDTPAIHYVVKEAVDAGIDDIIIITGRGKRAIEDYFDASPELEIQLSKSHKMDVLEQIKQISSLANIYYIRQKEPKGLPDAVGKAEKHIGDEPFTVLLGDDIFISQTPCIHQLMEAFNKVASSVIAVQDVPLAQISRYGSVVADKVDIDLVNEVFLIRDIIEKPRPEDAPSTLASFGRYVFTPEIFDCIKRTKPGVNNELQIADSIMLLAQRQQVYASTFQGKRYDIGDKFGYIQAIVDFALEHKEIAADVKAYLLAMVKNL
jgi:UTP--glucose-1-phosphate uridylyltransferase